MTELREISNSQDGRIDEIREYMHDESQLMRTEVARKFLEQSILNESMNDGNKIIIKKMHTIKNDSNLHVNKLAATTRSTQLRMDDNELEFNKMLRMMKSIVEVLFVDS